MLFTGTTEHVASETWDSKNTFLLILVNLFRMDKSIEDFDKAIELDSQNSIIYSNRGLVNRKLERFEKAIEDYGSEIKHGPPSNIKAFNNRAYCYAKLG
jgi:tetratricopeptide (TPR) repeat protein